MLRWIWLPFAVGCSFEHGFAGGGGGTGSNVVIDSGVTISDTASTQDTMTIFPADGQQCWSVASVGVTVCLPAPRAGNVTVGSSTSIDTDSSGTGSLQCKALQQGSTNVCVIAASSITINATRRLSAHGDRPLVLIASTIEVNGTIDVASHRGGQEGAGATSTGCNAGMNPSSSDGGGGQGGSFGTKGGNGGNEDNQNGSRGMAGNPLTVTTLRGGCSGSDGGNDGGDGGDGGGAVLLIADTITFGTDGAINASGESGGGAPTGKAGGGGAGSGGMIALSAQMITVGANTQIFANGGHGGGGSGSNTAGAAGTDPTSATSTGGGGANGGGNAGDGGPGYPAANLDGTSGTANGDGGGGGGGGGGIIRNDSTSSLGANVSPPAS